MTRKQLIRILISRLPNGGYRARAAVQSIEQTGEDTRIVTNDSDVEIPQAVLDWIASLTE